MALTAEHYIAMQAAEDGADIYSYAIASRLRDVQREKPKYIEITKPMMYDGDGTDQMPYFGAILTPAGLEAMDKFFEHGEGQ